MKIRNFISELKLGLDAKREVERVLQLPEVKAIFEREEGADIEARKNLIKQLKAIPASYEKRLIDAARQHSLAKERLQKAQTELQEARQEEARLDMVLYGLENAKSLETMNLLKEIQAGRDKRIDTVYLAVSNLKGLIPGFIRLGIQSGWTYRHGGKLISNCDLILYSTAILQDCLEEVGDMAVSALTYDEATGKLKSICAKAQRAAKAFGLNAPVINERGEVVLQRVGDAAIAASDVGNNEAVAAS